MSILNRETGEPKIKAVHGTMPVTSKYTAGIAGEIFFQNLKQGRITGSECTKCEKTYLPARIFCERCMSRLEKNKVAPEEGTLKTVTEAWVDLDGQRLDKPEIIGFVEFEGFTGGLVHRINPNGKELKIGAKVKPIFASADKQTNTILDIEHFALV